MISFERLNINNVDWEKVYASRSVNIFQTLPWINYLTEIQNVQPIMAAVKSDGQMLGYYTGFITNKFGLKILGSPFRGWTTYFMGFNLAPEASYHDVLQAFPKFAFDELGCQYFEIIDPQVNQDNCGGLPYRIERLPWFALDLSGNEETIFAKLTGDCRRRIRRANDDGIVIEEAHDAGFVDDYYRQFQDVMSKKSMVPTYKIDSVRKLIDYFTPTGNLILLRARNADGECVATEICLALNQTGVGWGAASWRQYQYLHPNEILLWQAMKALHARGVKYFHLGGESEEFKRKFGAQDAQLYRLRKARNPVLDQILNVMTSPKNSRYRNWMLGHLRSK
jgi:hypothetical protein